MCGVFWLGGGRWVRGVTLGREVCPAGEPLLILKNHTMQNIQTDKTPLKVMHLWVVQYNTLKLQT